MIATLSAAATRQCDSAAKRRHDVAMGVSPWYAVPKSRLSPNGAPRILAPRIPVALSGLNGGMNAHHGLTPVATTCRPVGTESQAASPHLVAELRHSDSAAQRHFDSTTQWQSDSAATRRHDVAMGVSPWNTIQQCDSAATRRHDVAMGVSPWNTAPSRDLSPDGATRSLAQRIPVALSGLERVLNDHHGLTPVATTCRPVGTESQGTSPHLVAELHAQFAESAKLEQAIKANLRGLGYGG